MTQVVLEREWAMLLTRLPADLEASARETGALYRRREIPSAEVLLRLAFVYALGGLSLRSTAGWAGEKGVAHLSDVAVLNRLRNAGPWLGRLLTEKLAERTCRPALEPEVARRAQVRRVRLMDATYASEPGSVGTDWRIHLGFNLASLEIDHAEVTDATGGETFARLPTEPGDLVVGDRGYAHRRGMHAVVAAGGELLVRLNWQNVPLQRPDGTPFDLLAALRGLAPGEVAEFAVQTAPDPKAELPAIGGRVVALAKHPAAAEAARRKLRQQYQKKGKTPDARTLEAAGYVFVFTTLDPERLMASEVLELYRFRWQVELLFKRMKGLLGLAELAADDPRLCRTFLLTKLLGALLVEDLCSAAGQAFSPWGYGTPRRLALAALATGGGDRAPGARAGIEPGTLGPTRRPTSRGAARTAAPPGPAGCPRAATGG